MSMMNKKTIEDIDLQGKTVLVRVDFNVPLDDDQKITDQTRIVAAMPTIRYLIDKQCKVILTSHLGRPKGFDAKCSLAPVAQRLSELLGHPVILTQDVIGDDAKARVAAMKPGDIVLLENVRFHKEEEKNDPEFAKALASYAQVYVNDAFGTAHRAHASTEGVAHILPAVAGYLIGKELAVLGKALESPERPFVAILGGKKVSDKIGVINNLLEKVDVLLIGGGMSFTFQKALGGAIGKSLLETDKVDLAAELLAKAKAKGVRLLLPVDTVIADAFADDANRRTVDASVIPDDWEGLDIGPKTSALFSEEIKKAKTVIWNGPMGVFEMPHFAVGTRAVAQAMADSSAITIIGGGDSAAAVEQMGFADQMTHISTGGGASLEFMEGLELPGVAALNDR